MSDLLGEFQHFLAQGDQAAGSASSEALLRILPPETASHLRLCAIPHEFNPTILRVLAPALDEARAHERYEEFSQLSCVTAVPDGLALHESTRRELFVQWLKPDRLEVFREAGARLVSHLDEVIAREGAAAGEPLIHQRMFHLLGADQPAGFAAFEALCRRARHESRWTACATLIRLVHEYGPVLSHDRGAWLTYHEGKLALDLQQWDQAKQLFLKALQEADTLPSLAVKARLRLGYLDAVQEDLAGAIEEYEKALTIVTEAHPEGAMAYDVLRSLGEAHRDLQEYERAEALLTESLAAAQAAADLGAVASAYNSLGTLYWKRREMAEAAAAYQNSLSALHRMGRKFQAAQAYNNLGMLYAEQTDWPKAEQSYKASLEIKRQAGDTLGQARTLVNLVQVFRARNEPDRAIDACREAIGLLESMRHTVLLARAHRSLGRLFVGQKDDVNARAAFRQAAETFEQCQAMNDAAATREELARVGVKVTVPWWAWAILGLSGVLVLLLLLLAVALIAGGLK